MRALLLVLLVLPMAGCSALFPRPEPYLTVGRIRIEASSPLSGPAADAVRRFDPVIRELLGGGWDGVIHVKFGPTPPEHSGTTLYPDRLVTVSPELSGQRFERILAHELVHCHMSGVWLDLPAAVQEGVAHLGSAIARGQVDAYGGPVAEPQALIKALTWSHRELYESGSDMRLQVEQAGTWVASRLIWRETSDGSTSLSRTLDPLLLARGERRELDEVRETELRCRTPR